MSSATLPHEKFYHMEAYERRMNALRAGEYVPPPEDAYNPDADLRAVQSAHKRKNIERDTYMSKEQLEELRKVQAERIQVRPRCAARVRSDFGCVGGQDEAARYGRKAEYGCTHGRDHVRRLRISFPVSRESLPATYALSVYLLHVRCTPTACLPNRLIHLEHNAVPSP